MSQTTKSPRELLKVAYELGESSLPERWHRFSPKTFSPAQLFACLVLKAFFQLDYRGTEQLLADCPELGKEIGLRKVPDYTTLCKAEKRLLDEDTTQRLLRETIKKALTRNKMKRLIELAAIDGSGFEPRHVSEHYKRRLNWTGEKILQKIFIKLELVVDTASHMIVALQTKKGPIPDMVNCLPLLQQAASNVNIHTLVGDKGYDSETFHSLARDTFGIETFIPARKFKSRTLLPKTKYRLLMTTNFNADKYKSRAQVETVFSMIKRRLRSALTARSFHSQNREVALRAITLNIMILFPFAL